MNKKGFSTVELLVSFIIISFVAIAMFKTVIDLLDKIKLYQDQSKITIINGNIINSVQKDMNQRKIYTYTSCGTNCYDITYQDLTVKKLKVDNVANTIRYGSITEKLPKNMIINGNIVLIKQTLSTPVNKNDSILKIYIPILDQTTNNDENINIVYQYDSRNIHITDLDTTSPVITILGDANISISQGTTYTDAGATAVDNIDGDLTSSITSTGSVNINIPGTYIITYNVTDSSGNIATTVTRTVVVMQAATLYAYTGNYQTYNVSATGKYKIEVWGSEGYPTGPYSGKGGYSSGEIVLTSGTALYAYAGGNQIVSGDLTFNGGRASGRYEIGEVVNSGGGSDVRLTSGAWNDLTSLRSRIIIAGGGGSYGAPTLLGGYGGGLSGETTLDGYSYGGEGGTQTAGGAGGGYESYGAFGIGGVGYAYYMGYGGAGGGGYYGGAGVYPDGGYEDAERGGGGGSGFVSGYTGCNAINSSGTHTGQANHFSGKVFTNGVMYSGNQSFLSPTGVSETGHAGTGYVRITYIGS